MRELILDTDASVQNWEERVIPYNSFALNPRTEEILYYLLGRIFTVRTDHSSLNWLLKFKDPQGQIARWMEIITV